MEEFALIHPRQERAYEPFLYGCPIDSVLVLADRPARVKTLVEAIKDRSSRVVLATIDEVRKRDFAGGDYPVAETQA